MRLLLAMLGMCVLLLTACGASGTPPPPADVPVAPTRTATIIPTPSVTFTPIPLPTNTATPTEMATNSPTPTASPTSTPPPTRAATSTDTATPTTPAPSALECVVTKPPATLNLDPFYEKYCAPLGVPIISAGVVPELALQKAADIVVHMLSAIPEVRREMIRNGLRVGIIGVKQVTTDMPEYRNLHEQFPDVDWNTRARGLGGTLFIPLATGAEENLLCYSNDRYRGESIFLHEFAHTIKSMGLEFVNPSFVTALQNAYDSAIATGLWANTYADDNVEEYWAEGVQSYFNTNLEATPANGIHNSVNTREELQAYDPQLYEIIASVFPADDWVVTCP